MVTHDQSAVLADAHVLAIGTMTPGEVIAMWQSSELKGRLVALDHFFGLHCLLGEPPTAGEG